jgi:type IV pilus assembly protein PilA
MQERNPYAAPRTNVAAGAQGAPEQYGEIRVFSASGRLGRVRYIGYSAGLGFLILLLVGVAAAVTSSNPSVALLIGGAGYVAIIVIQFLLTIQRAHDMNTTGWLSLILLIPLAGLLFWFIPGTKGENNYGLQPPPNSVGVILLACIVPFVGVIGVLAAIAIPAYQDYTIRAQVSEGLNLAAAPKVAVANAFSRTRVAPGDRLAAGLSAAATDTAGKYVESIDVAGGTILVTYGSNANAVIAGRMLALQPYVAGDDSVVWLCGRGSPPGGAVPMDGGAITAAGATEIDPRHLPSACRP